MTIEVARRSFITGLISLVAAPAIVRAGSLMPVKSIVEPITAEDIAALLMRLDDRGNIFDHQYAARYGSPVLGPIDEKTRQTLASLSPRVYS